MNKLGGTPRPRPGGGIPGGKDPGMGGIPRPIIAPGGIPGGKDPGGTPLP